MIDFHNHILPNIDDGSKSLDMSLDMLRCAAQQGITDVVNTVHFQHPKLHGKEISFEFIKKEILNLQTELNHNNIPIKIHMGSEVFYLPNLIDIKDNPLVTMGGGKYMLIEFQPHHIPNSHKEQLFNLKLAGITPIIAHPERYINVQEDIDLVLEWLLGGSIIQVDAGSPLGKFGKNVEKCSKEIIRNGWCQIIGSDSHNNKNRNFCLKQSLECINQIMDKDMSILVRENPQKIMHGDIIKVDIEYEKSFKQSTFLSRIKNKLGIG